MKFLIIFFQDQMIWMVHIQFIALFYYSMSKIVSFVSILCLIAENFIEKSLLSY